jgi:2'-phosphotransferase
MARTHIHLAPALSDHAILPRPNSTLRIYLDPSKLHAASIPLYTSLNGVVLTPGNEDGVVTSEYWSMAERKVDGQWVEMWRDGREVDVQVESA